MYGYRGYMYGYRGYMYGYRGYMHRYRGYMRMHVQKLDRRCSKSPANTWHIKLRFVLRHHQSVGLAVLLYCSLPCSLKVSIFLEGPSPHAICSTDSNQNTLRFGMSKGKLMIAPSFALGLTNAVCRTWGSWRQGWASQCTPWTA